MRTLKSSLTVIGAIVVLLLAGNTIALAATGKALIAGKTSTAGKLTGLTRTSNGPALSVRTKRTTDAPLVVNGRGRVANLNADTVDGLDSSALRQRTYLWSRTIEPGAASKSFELNLNLPNGTYEVGYSMFPNGAFADGDTINCYLSRQQASSAQLYVAENRSTQVGLAKPSVSGVGIITVGTGQNIRMSCDSSTAFSTFSSQPIQVYANPTTIASSSSARSSAR